MRAFVAERVGGTAWDELVATLGDAEAATVRGVVAAQWYDPWLRARLLRELQRRHGDHLALDLGRFEAELDVTRLQRWFIRLVPPTLAIRNMNKYWRRTEESGRWISKVDGEVLIAELHDRAVVEPALCFALQGYLERMLEFLRCEASPVVHSRCRAGGDGCCEFRTEYIKIPSRRRHSNEPVQPNDVHGIGGELGDLRDLEAVTAGIVEMLQARLSFSYVALWVHMERGREPRQMARAGTQGQGEARCLILVADDVTVGRLDVEGPADDASVETLDLLLPRFADALIKAGACAEPDADRARRLHLANERWTRTERERDVLGLLIQGKSNKEIGQALGIAEPTVEHHVTRILKQSGATSRYELQAKFWKL